MPDLHDQEREALDQAAYEYKEKIGPDRIFSFANFEAGFRAALAAREETGRPDGMPQTAREMMDRIQNSSG